MSDPATHAPELGSKPVMLYQVKWVGFETPSWEPVTSFDDTSIVDEYWVRVRARKEGSRGVLGKEAGKEEGSREAKKRGSSRTAGGGGSSGRGSSRSADV